MSDLINSGYLENDTDTDYQIKLDGFDDHGYYGTYPKVLFVSWNDEDLLFYSYPERSDPLESVCYR